MIGYIPELGVILFYIIPLIIFAIVLYKLFKLAEAFIKSHSQTIKDKLADRDWMLTAMKFIPYGVMFYYIIRFTAYMFTAETWGMVGDEFIVASIRNSTLAMTDMLLMEGIPVTLTVLIGTTILRIAYEYIVEGEG